jgi:hypothetical protein
MKKRMYFHLMLSCIGVIGCAPTISLRVNQTPEGTALLQPMTRGLNSYIGAMAIWNNSDLEWIWVLRSRPIEETNSFEVAYSGDLPKQMYQVFPKENRPPRELKAGEVIVVEVFASYDWLAGPMGTSASWVFRIAKDGRWVRLWFHERNYPANLRESESEGQE